MDSLTNEWRCYHWVARVPECLDGLIPPQFIASPDLAHEEMCCDGCCEYYRCNVCRKQYDVDSRTGRPTR